MGARRQGQGGAVAPPPWKIERGENMHKIIVLNRFFLLTVEFMKLKITSIINCQNKCYCADAF